MTVEEALQNVTIVVRQARMNAEEHEALKVSLNVLGNYAKKGYDAEFATGAKEKEKKKDK